MSASQQQDRRTLRQAFRRKRNALTAEQQHTASKGLLSQLQSYAPFLQAEHVALYLANDGELDPQQVIHWCWQHGKQVYLPVLHAFCPGHLVFVRYAADSPMTRNRFGIAEPRLECPAIQPLAELDLVLTPLVGFDTQGNRLGMGGGFYDRTLAPVQRDNLEVRLTGIAHDCQQTNHLQADSWDIPLQNIVTPSRVFSCS